jgi:Zn-dependent protease with chaperone function
MTDAAIAATYFDGRVPVGNRIRVVFTADAVVVGRDDGERTYARAALRVSPRIAGADRFITLPDGGELQCPDDARLDTLPSAVRSERLVSWLEQRWAVAVGCIGAVVATVVWGYLVVVPAAATAAAERIPIETEAVLGEQALAWLDRQMLEPSQVPRFDIELVRQRFAWLCAGLPFERHYRLEFRRLWTVPNALALPGGIIVLTDGLIDLAQDDDELLAVLAHEAGHIELRHPMRAVLQGSAVAVAAATLTADAATVSAAVAGLPALLANARYSRELESAADDYAMALLGRKGISPEAFAAILERLVGEDHGLERAFGYLNSHPVTADRIARARGAAGGSQ